MSNDLISNVVKIGIWGPPKSGKTTYLSLLQFASHDGWKIRPKDKFASDLLVMGYQSLRKKNESVPSTQPGNPQFLPFEFVGPKGFLRGSKSFTVILPESAGEDYEKPDPNGELVREICRSHGIIWMIDPLQIDNPKPDRKNYLQMIQEWLYLLYSMEGYQDIKKYMAFCLTKMDHPNHVAHINEPYNYCLHKLGPEVAGLLEDYCTIDRIRFFATSAVGLTKDGKSNMDPITEELLNPAEPVGLFDPFRWLFGVL